MKANQAQGIKPYVLRGHLAIQRSSENIYPEEIADGILLDKWVIWTINNENLSKQSLLFWCQDLKMRHGFLGV